MGREKPDSSLTTPELKCVRGPVHSDDSGIYLWSFRRWRTGSRRGFDLEGELILLVEDNPDDEALTLRALKRNNIKNDVIVAHDGVEALDFLFGTGGFAGRDLSEMPEVILLDLKLPRVDGLEVLRRIREDARTQVLPVVVLTTSTEEQDRLRSYHLGANSYVRKPVDFNEFIGAVGQLGLYWLILNERPPLVRGA